MGKNLTYRYYPRQMKTCVYTRTAHIRFTYDCPDLETSQMLLNK